MLWASFWVYSVEHNKHGSNSHGTLGLAKHSKRYLKILSREKKKKKTRVKRGGVPAQLHHGSWASKPLNP